ncbi:hypothetical protein [Ralstonia sp. OTU4908]|jgi:hypothetical protein|uniref:hypothetical protein n=1 Tax=Ralstonia sp. OTU4908 TaxID=3043851 RepID=UPI00313AD4E3
MEHDRCRHLANRLTLRVIQALSMLGEAAMVAPGPMGAACLSACSVRTAHASSYAIEGAAIEFQVSGLIDDVNFVLSIDRQAMPIASGRAALGDAALMQLRTDLELFRDEAKKLSLAGGQIFEGERHAHFGQS